MADEGEEIFEDDGQEFVAGFAQFEHLGPRQKEGLEFISSLINSGQGMSSALKEAGRMKLNPEVRFLALCDIYHNKFGGDQGTNIPWAVISGKIPSLKWSKYKNPIGFVFAPRLFDENKQVDQDRFRQLVSSQKELFETEKIAKEDIVRYVRLWKSLLQG